MLDSKLQLPPGLRSQLERTIRIGATRSRKTHGRRAGHHRPHSPAALLQHPIGRQNPDRRTGGSLLRRRRYLAGLPARVQHERCRLGRTSSRCSASTPKPASSCCSIWTSPLKRRGSSRSHLTQPELVEAIVEGAAKRLRPKFMTFATMSIGLAPILWSTGTGSAILKRIAAPMVGGIVTSFVLELLVYPVIYSLWRTSAGQEAIAGHHLLADRA